MSAPALESPNLWYEAVSRKHCTERYLGWLLDPEVTRYLDSGGDYTMRVLENYVDAMSNRPEVLFWAIHLKSNRCHIGNIKIEGIHKIHKRGEYGILMGDRQVWGRGYAREASLRIMEYCFETLNLRKITLGVVEDNERALKLYQGLGFVVEGIYRNHGFYNGKWCNVVRMAAFNSHTEA